MPNAITVREITPAQSHLMHLMRGVAALLVLCEHVKNRVFGPEVNLETFGALAKLPRVVLSLGHESVIVFFVLSGFLVGRKMLLVRKRSDVLGYFIARFSRIYVVAVPALLLSWITANVTTSILGFSYYHSGPDQSCSPSLLDVTWNLLLVNKILVPTLCSNTPFWSIQNEMSYYLLFAVAFFGATLTRSSRERLVCAISLLAVVAFLAWEPIGTANTLLYSGFWLAGAIGSLKNAKAVWALLAVAMIYVSIWLAGLRLEGQFATDITVGALTMACILAGHHTPIPRQVSAMGRIASDVSFSLYLVHVPVIDVLTSIAIARDTGPGTLDESSPTAWLLVTLYIAAALAVSSAMYWLFERRTPEIRKRLNAWASPSRQASR